MAISLKLPLVVVDDADLLRVSEQNPGYQFEREEDGTLTVSPNFSDGGAKSGKAYRQLDTYADTAGGRAFDSSAGFRIGRLDAVKSPDAAWVSSARAASLSPSQRSGYWQISPDVAIELRSISDTFRDTIAKIDFYMENGTRYAVAIDPFTREVVTRGEPPDGLSLDFDTIIDA
jgi:Uma2 family endonuclease